MQLKIILFSLCFIASEAAFNRTHNVTAAQQSVSKSSPEFLNFIASRLQNGNVTASNLKTRSATSNHLNSTTSRLNSTTSQQQPKGTISRLNITSNRLNTTSSRPNTTTSLVNTTESRLNTAGSRLNTTITRLNTTTGRLNTTAHDLKPYPKINITHIDASGFMPYLFPPSPPPPPPQTYGMYGDTWRSWYVWRYSKTSPSVLGAGGICAIIVLLVILVGLGLLKSRLSSYRNRRQRTGVSMAPSAGNVAGIMSCNPGFQPVGLVHPPPACDTDNRKY